MQEQKSNIILIGMRGSGKTTVARLLSEQLKRPYVELDSLLVDEAHMTIPEVVEKHGWQYFRDLEERIAQRELETPNRIVSTGGGIVLRDENRKHMREKGIVIYLKGSAQTLLARTGDDPNRPALTQEKTRQEEIETLLKQRSSLYEATADEIIDTDGKTPDAVASETIEKIKNGL